jgi:hypothetical protein
MYQVATNGVKLQVPKLLAHQARIILSQKWSLPDEVEDSKVAVDDLLDVPDEDWDDGDHPDDEGQERLPEPGATRLWIMEAVFLLVLLTPLIIWLMARLSRPE